MPDSFFCRGSLALPRREREREREGHGVLSSKGMPLKTDATNLILVDRTRGTVEEGQTKVANVSAVQL